MSYKTNTTANRLKFNKGWKTSYFPENLTFYSRDNVFWFKLFLFLKAYFTLKKIKLISCDLRVSEEYNKILYLVINTIPKRKRKKFDFTSYKKVWSGNKYSLLRNAYAENNINLLFFNLPKLKRNLVSNLLPFSKQNISFCFFTKPRFKSWLNYHEQIHNSRSTYTNKYIKYKTNNAAIFISKNKRLKLQQHLRWKLLRIKNELIVLNKIFSSLYKRKNLTTKLLFFFKKKLYQLKTKNKKLQKLITISQIKLKKNKNFSNNIILKTYFLPYSKKTKINKYLFLDKVNKIKLPFGPWRTALNQKINKIKKTNKINKAKWIHNNFVNSLKVLNPVALRIKKNIRKKQFIKNLNKKQFAKIYIKYKKLRFKRSRESSITTQEKKIKYTYKFLPTISYKQNRLKALTKSINKIKYNVIHKFMIKSKSNEENLDSLKIPTKWLKLKKPKKKIRKKITYKHIRFTKKIRTKKTLKISRLNNNSYKNMLLKLTTIFKQYYKVSNNTKSIRYYSKYLSLIKSQYLGLNPNRHKVLHYQDLNLGSFLMTNKSLLCNNQKLRNRDSILLPRVDYIKKTFTRILQLHKRKKRSNAPYLHQFLRFSRIRKKLYCRPRTFYKKNLNNLINIKLNKDIWQNINKIRKNIWEKERKKSIKKSIWQLRQGFRTAYKTNLNLILRYKYKLGLQKLLFKFFKCQINIKFVQPLTQFKNIKFFRLLYQIPRYIQTKQILLHNKQQTKRKLQKKDLRIFFKNQQKSLNKNNKLLSRKKTLKKTISLRKRYIYIGNNMKRFLSKDLPIRITNKGVVSFEKANTYIFKKKVNVFEKAYKQSLIDFTKNKLMSAKKALLMQSFTPILSLFIKYLDPQVLADHIAKEFEKTKKHKPILYGLSAALRFLHMTRGLGYRISITGRINSAAKSRVFYLKRQTIVRQAFSKRINFASAQSRARIGTFGVKVWLFF